MDSLQRSKAPMYASHTSSPTTAAPLANTAAVPSTTQTTLQRQQQHPPAQSQQPQPAQSQTSDIQQPKRETPPPPPKMRVVLQNVTATLSLRIIIDPYALASKVKNAEFNPKKLPACVMRIREPQATGLLFQSGKLVVTGATGVEAANEAAQKFVSVVSSVGLKPSFANFAVQNMVATAEMKYPINLELMAYSHARWCMYEPELFPGLIYQTSRRGIVAHIFSSGRVVLTGAKQEEHLNDALEVLLPVLQQYRQVDSKV